jgi:signal transduction histidine kinase
MATGESATQETRLQAVWRSSPVSGMLWQLAFVYSILLLALLIAFGLWIFFSGHDPLWTITSGIIALTIIGAVVAYLLTRLLLRPLRQITDTTQAITFGDLEQRARLRPLMQGNDEISKLATSIYTMAEQTEQAHDRQRTAEQRSRRLFSDAAHQLRTPLTSIRGFTDVLLRGAMDDPAISQRVLPRIRVEAERLTMLVNDLLLLVQLDADNPLQMQYVNLYKLMSEEVERIKMIAANEREVSLLPIEAEEEFGIQGHEEHLKHVIHILIENALSYGAPAPSGWIHLSLNREDDYIVLQISNNGKGIHPSDLPHVFERFFRGQHIPIYDETIKTPPPGTGLGLSIAQAIVQAHAGEISVKSTPNSETVFTIKFHSTEK